MFLGRHDFQPVMAPVDRTVNHGCPYKFNHKIFKPHVIIIQALEHLAAGTIFRQFHDDDSRYLLLQLPALNLIEKLVAHLPHIPFAGEREIDLHAGLLQCRHNTGKPRDG